MPIFISLGPCWLDYFEVLGLQFPFFLHSVYTPTRYMAEGRLPFCRSFSVLSRAFSVWCSPTVSSHSSQLSGPAQEALACLCPESLLATFQFQALPPLSVDFDSVWEGSSVIFCVWMFIFPSILWKRLFFLQLYFWHLCQKSYGYRCVGFFMGPRWGLVGLHVHYHTVFVTVTLSYNLR